VFGLRDSNNSSPSTSRRRRPTLLSGSQTPTQRDVTVSDEELEDSGLLSQFAARVTSSLEAFSARPGKSIWADLYDFRLTDEDKAVIAAIAPKSTSELTDAERRIAELAEDNAKLRQELLTEQQTRLQMIKEFAEGSARMSDLQTDMQALQEEAKETIARAHALEDNNFAQQREIDSLLARIADLSTQMDATLASRRHEEELEAEQAKSTKLSQRVAELEGDLVNEKRKAEAAEKALQNHQMQIMDMQQKYMAMMQMFAKPHAAAPSSSTPPASGSAPSQGAANSSMPYMPSPYPSFPMGAPWMHQVVHPSQTMQPMGNSLSAILS
jgi:chromosome segregation ATPase